MALVRTRLARVLAATENRYTNLMVLIVMLRFLLVQHEPISTKALISQKADEGKIRTTG